MVREPVQDLKGWYRRGDQHPPHFDAGELAQCVTFRLDGTLPQEKLDLWKQELRERRLSDEDYHERIEEHLDSGMGHCWLRDTRVARLIESALLHFDRQRYDLAGWVIMPNHVHVLIIPHLSHRLPDILHSWKSFTSKEANKLIGRSGTFWQDDFFDRYIRDEEDWNRTLTYIADNPVRAGLCQRAEQWPWSHVGWRCRQEAAGAYESA